jgi:hypothetical protein
VVTSDSRVGSGCGTPTQPRNYRKTDDMMNLGNDCASPQYNYLVDRLIKIEVHLSRRRLLDVIKDAVDDVSGAIGIPTTQLSACLTSLKSGGCMFRQF